MFIEYLKELLGHDNVVGKESYDIVLPLYLRNYEYSLVSLYEQIYVFVTPKDKVNLKSYKAQKDKIEEEFSCSAVLVLEKLNTSQRQNLIANKIMFVEIGKQLFMPMSGIVLNKEKTIEKKQVEKFTPQIQLCALFFVYNQDRKKTVKQIAEKTKLNEMAISRGMKVLEELKLISSEINGRTKYYSLCVNVSCYLESIIQYAISPICKFVWVNKAKKPQCVFQAGYSALSDYSMLVDNRYETYAISKEEYNRIEQSTRIEFEDLLDEQDYIRLQVWKYDPALFADNGVVDKFSLYMSFEQGQDERTEAILKEIKESIING